MDRRTTATLVGIVSGLLFFPFDGVTACPSGADCRETVATFWGLEMPGEVGSLVWLIAAVTAGALTYWLLTKRTE